MRLPPFDQFLDDMGEGFPAALVSEAVANVGEDLLPMERAVAVSCIVTELMLRRYHDWLSAQIAT